MHLIGCTRSGDARGGPSPDGRERGRARAMRRAARRGARWNDASGVVANRSEVDLDAAACFLVPSDTGAIRSDPDNTGHVETDLVGPDGVVRPVAVVWRSERHPEERLEAGVSTLATRGRLPRVPWRALRGGNAGHMLRVT